MTPPSEHGAGGRQGRERSRLADRSVKLAVLAAFLIGPIAVATASKPLAAWIDSLLRGLSG